MIMGQLYKALKDKQEIVVKLAAATEQLTELTQEHRTQDAGPRQEQGYLGLRAGSKDEQMQKLESQLAVANLQSLVNRTALEATYKMLDTLDERRQLQRILQLAREHFTKSSNGSAYATKTTVESPQQAQLPLTPVSMNHTPEPEGPEDPEHTTTFAYNLRPRKSRMRVDAFGSPISYY